MDANPQGAQMLDAREYQVGDAARLFGIPGRLMEYSTAGTSLTYQNLSEVWADFVRGCLAPNYLEPIEQALSDLLPRATVARFHRDVLLQSDIKTRFDVYGTAIDKGILTAGAGAGPRGLPAGRHRERQRSSRASGRHPRAHPEAIRRVRPVRRADGQGAAGRHL